MDEPFDGQTLFHVSFEVDVVVLAKSRKDAERIAKEDWYDISRDCDPDATATLCEITIAGKKRWALPADWDDSEPYGKHGGKTCKTIIEEINEHRRTHPTQADLEAAGQQVLSGCK